MLKFFKKNCTNETNGSIINKKWRNEVCFITAQYEVDGIQYTIKEQLTYHIEKKYKIWKIPIGFHSVSALDKTEIGSSVRVQYNPNKPKQAYMPDNNGHHFS